MPQKWFHAIGACGHTTAMVAKMFVDMGWFVTGTDTQFLPPGSRNLTDAGVHFELGYDYTHLTKSFWETKLGKKIDVNEHPDLCLIISNLTSGNREFRYAKLKGLTIKPYAQILREYLVKKNSIVLVGTAGKTTTTSFITYILKELDLDPSYMIAADSVNFEPSLRTTNSSWSIVEGDEYHSKDAEIEKHAKFMEYNPQYLIIPNIGYEHQDIYPTVGDYINEFKKVVKLVPSDGLIIARADSPSIEEVIKEAKTKVLRYKLTNEKNLSPGKDTWLIVPNEDKQLIYSPSGELVVEIKSELLGDYTLENLLAGIVLILNVPELKEELDKKGGLEKLQKIVSKYKGVKKRLEVLYKSENLIVMDDFGVTPPRASNSLETIHQAFPDFKILAVFEPYSAGRPKDFENFSKLYQNVFKNTSEVIIPTLSTVNPDLISGLEFVNHLKQMGTNATFVESSNLLNTLNQKISADKNYKTLIVFFSSYRLEEIAYQLVKEIS